MIRRDPDEHCRNEIEGSIYVWVKQEIECHVDEVVGIEGAVVQCARIGGPIGWEPGKKAESRIIAYCEDDENPGVQEEDDLRGCGLWDA